MSKELSKRSQKSNGGSRRTSVSARSLGQSDSELSDKLSDKMSERNSNGSNSLLGSHLEENSKRSSGRSSGSRKSLPKESVIFENRISPETHYFGTSKVFIIFP